MEFICKKMIMKQKNSNNNNKDNFKIKSIKEGYIKYKNKENNNYILKNNISSIFLLNFIILFISLSLSKEEKISLRNLNYDSIITLVIKKTGKQQIINNNYQFKPYEVTLNEDIQTPINDYVLIEEEIDNNIIVIKFHTIINSTNSMFSNTNCTSIDFSRFDFSQVTDMSKMFFSCKYLESINFGHINSSSVINMSSLFSGCIKLTSIDLSSFNTASVIDMGDMFYRCILLKSLDLWNFNTSEVINMSNMFNSCSNLISVNLSSFDTSLVTSMYAMFKSCYKLSSLNLSYFNTPSLTTVEEMFSSCTNLKLLDLSSFSTSKVTTFSKMFAQCINLLSLDLSNFNTSSANSFDFMFYKCKKITSINLKSFVTSKVNSMTHTFDECEELVNLDLSNFDTSSLNYMPYMFHNCKSLSYLDLSSFNGLSVFVTQDAFNGCISLTSLDLSNFKASSVFYMDSMFSNCQNLKYLNLSSFITSSCRSMKYMFSNCTKLEFLDISNYDTSHVSNMDYMFHNCKKLKALDLSHFNISSLTSINNMFSNCSSLIYLNLDIKLNTIPNELSKDDFISNISDSVKICINSFYLNVLNLSYIQPKCDDICFQKNIKILWAKRECTVSCIDDTQYKLEYYNLCYDTCPTGSIRIDYLCKEIKNCSKYTNIDRTECFNEIKEGYFLKDQNSKILEKCHENCKSCEGMDTPSSTNCKSCPDRKFLLFGNCVDSCKYSNDTDSLGNNICKCPDKCKDCSKESYDLDLCTSCNDNFYPIFEENEKKEGHGNNGGIGNKNDIGNMGGIGNKPINCYQNPEGYYLDKIIEKYKPCHLNCKTCSDEGSFENNNCDLCKDNFIFIEENDKNCYEKCNYFYYFDESNKYRCTEKEECPRSKQNKLILQKGKCIDKCKNDNKYKNEFNNTCYEICPNGTIPNNYICVKKEEPITTQEASTTTIITEEEQMTTIITEKASITTIQTVSESVKTEVEPLTTKITEEKEEETITTKITTEEEKSITIITTVTDSILNCSAEALFIAKSCGTGSISPENKDQLISNIENDIMNHKFDTILDNITKNNEDLLIKNGDDTIFQITTSTNQKNNKYNNISTINLGDCENRLKQIYKIDPSLSLIIFKLDYYSPGLLIPIISYEIFHPENKSKLDLNYCKDIFVELNIPVSIDEDNLYKYDPNSDYYNDECTQSTSEDGTDILISDRQSEYNNNNLSLCQNNCSFNGYEKDTKKVLCDCEVRTKITLVTEIIDDKNKLSDFNVTNITRSSNAITMKCISTLFTKEGLISNYGSYIFIFIILEFLVSSILFYKIGYYLLEDDMGKIIREKEEFNNKTSTNKDNIDNIDIYNKEPKKPKRKKKKKKKKKTATISYPPKKKDVTVTKINLLKSNDNLSQSKVKLKDSKNLLNFQKSNANEQMTIKKTKNKLKKKKSIKFENNIKYNIYNNNFNDFELNSLTYNEALLYDKRTYIQYYLSLIKTKHPIIFSFLPNADYNTIIIKINILIISFSFYYVINACFFDEVAIHQIYEDSGEYIFSFFVLPIVLSFIFGHILSTIIKYIFLSERNIFEIRKETNLVQALEKKSTAKKNIILKYIIFFVAGTIILIFFWYYMSSFGAVYQNTQLFIIKNTLISCLMSLIYPFIINFLPGIFRISALNDTQNKKECIFKFSKILQLI